MSTTNYKKDPLNSYPKDMLFNRDQSILFANLNIACYTFCQTGACTLPDGFTRPQPIVAAPGSDILLREDPMTSWGMITVCDGREYVIFRGTQDEYERHRFICEWCEDLFALPTVMLNGGGHVHRGFHDAWMALKPKVVAGLKNDSDPIIIGHSLGASIGQICSVDLGYKDVEVFACPRTGDLLFAARLTECVSLMNEPDIVPRVPYGFGFTPAGKQILVHGPGFLELHVAHSLASYVAGLEKLSAL